MTRSKTVAALREIRNRHPKKLLMPRDVVTAARDKHHPLHAKFDWNDKTAGHAYRIGQARELIAEIKIYIDEDQRQSAPAYISLIEDRQTGGGYRAIEEVLPDKDLRQKMLKTAIAEFNTMKFRFDSLTELSKIWREVGRVAKKVTQ